MNVAKWVILAVLALPILELAAFIAVAAAIGFGWALSLMLAGSLCGALILRLAGSGHVARIRAALDRGSFAALQTDARGGLTLLAYAIWWGSRMLPRLNAPKPAPYRPPAALFGMDLAPEKLPADDAAAAVALAREGKLREALGLLYRGALSELVHKRGVRLLASHTEGEAAAMANLAYFSTLVAAWQSCAYASRVPPADEIERLAADYGKAFA